MIAPADQPLPFIPCTSDHSVKEASVGVFAADAIGNLEDFASYIRGNEFLTDNFPTLNTIYKNGEEYSIYEPESNQSVVSTGLVIGNLDEGNNPIRFFQAVNEEDRQYFSFHEFNYIRWAPFKEMLINTIQCLHNFDSSLNINGISLTYVDEYHWLEGESIDYNRIFVKGNKYLPAVFFEEGNTDAPLNSTMYLMKGAFKFYVRLSIQPVIEEKKQTLRIIHNAVSTDIVWSFSYLTSKDNTEFPVLIQAAHELNKDVLKEILLPKVQEMINMT